ncbi:MAG TPA: IS1634 family transposase [Ignavibacteria bacterium]|nr:IS1634 family transposase [Ignavibacteria bacterium]
MFVRKKKNQSGSVSIQIIQKIAGKNKLIKSVGAAKDEKDIKILINKAYSEMPELKKQRVFDFGHTKRDFDFLHSLRDISRPEIKVVGPNLVLGNIFNSIGFNEIKEPLFKKLVIARIVNPVSKLKTAEYWKNNNELDITSQSIYKFLDRLHKNYKTKIEQISYNYTKRILKNITVVFYDMTTIYFEAKEEDDLRKIGFSKDGKFQKPQIMLGLLVGEDGYPIGYDIFEGNTFEGKTMLPIIKRLQGKYGFSKPIVVADSGLLSDGNIKELKAKKYEFILGARIKNISNKQKKEILKKSKNLKNGKTILVDKDGDNLIISFSDSRAKKDKYNREKGLKKLKIRIKSGKLTKEQINNRGYNKFLKIKNQVEVELDESKVGDDEKWDGLKGYLTNTNLSNDEVIENYRNLWKIEKAFRISKNDLKIRPIFHYKKERIEAHICLSFTAYTIYKELERLLKVNKSVLSVTQAIELLDTIYEITVMLPESGKIETISANLSEIQLELLRVTQV